MQKNHAQRPIILAAGGTGGHIFPAEALAEALLSRGEKVVLITDRRFMNYGSKNYEGIIGKIPVHYIWAGSLAGGLLTKMLAMVKILAGIVQAYFLIQKLKPKAVVGFGGYPSFPTMMAATHAKCVAIIHEQNSVLGKTNRFLCARMSHIATSYRDTKFLPANCGAKTVLTGNPVRAAIKALHHIPYPELREDGTLRILIMGGSQGAHIFSDVVPAAIALLPNALRQRIRIDQQCRVDDLAKTKEAYQAIGVQPDLATFFNDVPARLASAHLVIGRAGASTIAELTCAGRPAILVPLPTSADNHQYFNAQAVEDVGGGWVMPQEGFTAEALAARLESLLNAPTLLAEAAKCAHESGQTDAAEQLAYLVNQTHSEEQVAKEAA